jgi:hypothetical protein
MTLKEYLYNRLSHIQQVGGTFGWEEHDTLLQELEEEGLVIGRWTGGLEYEPRPVWQISDKGRKALSEYHQSKQTFKEILINGTSD